MKSIDDQAKLKALNDYDWRKIASMANEHKNTIKKLENIMKDFSLEDEEIK